MTCVSQEDGKPLMLVTTDESSTMLENEINRSGVIKAFLVQIVVLANHQNGKDTHLRGVKIFAPGDSILLNLNQRSPDDPWPEEVGQDRLWSIR